MDPKKLEEVGVAPRPEPDRRTLTEYAADPLVDEAGRQLRAPGAAGLAGNPLCDPVHGGARSDRNSPLTAATNAELAQLFANGRDQWLLIGGLYLAPFAGIMFLWFVAVVRDQIGEREDRFFATVFFGSGLIFVALLFAAAAVASTVVVAVRELGLDAPTEPEVEFARSLAYALLFGFATRAAAVFLFSTATLGLRSRAFPRWVAWTGYLIGLVLLLVVTFWDWIILLFPAWVAVVSVFILRREQVRRRVVNGGA